MLELNACARKRQKNGSCCYYRRRYRCVKEQKHRCGTETRRRNRTSAFRGPPHEQRLEKTGIHTQKTGRRYPYCSGTYQYVLETDRTDIEGSGLFSVVNAICGRIGASCPSSVCFSLISALRRRASLSFCVSAPRESPPAPDTPSARCPYRWSCHR